MDRLNLESEICDAIKEVTFSLFKEKGKNLVKKLELTVNPTPRYGDLSTNFCLIASKKLKQSPFKIAQKIKKALDEIIKQDKLKSCVHDIKVEGTGFLNFYLSKELKLLWLENIYKEKYFNNVRKIGKGKKVSVEFVSANPTGPITVAHARQAVVGDSISNIYKFCGYNVTREYYINDEGKQIELLGKSVQTRCMEILNLDSKLPEDGYKGEYITDIAKKLMSSLSIEKIIKNKYEEKVYSDKAVQLIINIIKRDLKNLGVQFDKWRKQSDITKDKAIKKLFKKLENKGFIYRKDKAVWFKSSMFGDSKDRTLIKKNGEYTYFAPDIIYHNEKLTENEKVIDVWGPDHHGYIPRIKAAVEAMGWNPELVTILIVQLTTIYSKGKPLSMSKRKGEFISLHDVLKSVGKDVTRFFLLMRRLASHLDFDLELAKQTSLSNPVYYIQYAYARICSIMRKAVERFCSDRLYKKLDSVNFQDLDNLNTDIEKEIIDRLIRIPDEILICFRSLESYRLVNYLQELVACFHKYYSSKRILLKDEKLTISRIYLCECIRKTISQGLNLLGINAPESM